MAVCRLLARRVAHSPAREPWSGARHYAGSLRLITRCCRRRRPKSWPPCLRQSTDAASVRGPNPVGQRVRRRPGSRRSYKRRGRRSRAPRPDPRTRAAAVLSLPVQPHQAACTCSAGHASAVMCQAKTVVSVVLSCWICFGVRGLPGQQSVTL